MSPSDPFTVTRDELVAVHREWETRRRLRPSTFSDPRDEYGLDVDESAERAVDFVLELLGEIRSTSGYGMAADSETSAPAPILDPSMLRPGDRLVLREDPTVVVTLEQRKGHDSTLPGWWLAFGAGGLADYAIADRWRLDVDPPGGSAASVLLRRRELGIEEWPFLADAGVDASEPGAVQDGPPLTADLAARKAAEALGRGDVDIAAGWTNLVRALS